MGATNCILLPPQGFNLVLYGNDKESKMFPKDRSQRHRKRVKEILVTEIDGKMGRRIIGGERWDTSKHRRVIALGMMLELDVSSSVGMSP
jgi:hypothetical protein